MKGCLVCLITVESIKQLLLKHLRGPLTAEEQASLNVWLEASAANRELFLQFSDPERVALSLEKMDRMQEDRVWERLQAHAAGDGAGEARRIGRVSRRRYRWMAAAVLIGLLGMGVYWLWYRTPSKQVASTQEQRFKNDVAPGRNAALLILAGGQKIVLDSSARGAISRQGNTTIINTTGQLVYKDARQKPAEVLYNTLTTGRGNQYQLLLPDGSKVWLNAASSITYPTSFTGAERKVSITGEAYFEIAKDEAHPFVVQKMELSIQVLGTHFNVNTYEDEDAWRTTLLEGSVKVVNGNSGSVLRPGQQAVIVKNTSNGQESIKVLNDPDIGEVMAWKNGVFRFNDATIESIMRQMARWYDVSVVYDTKITQHFVADVPRDVPVSELLKLLELTDQVHFKIEGKKITVIR